MKSEILLSLICLFTFIQTVSSSEEHKEEHIFCRICGNVIADYSDRTFVPSRGARDIRSYDVDHQDLIVDTIRTNNGEKFEAIQVSRVKDHSIQKVLEATVQSSEHYHDYQYEQIYCAACNTPIGTHYMKIEELVEEKENPAQGESKEANNEEEDEEFDPNQEVRNEMDQQVEDIIESAFQKVHCLHYSPSYWSYEICNRKEITQYHMNIQLKKKEPLYSLGVFEDEQDYDMGFTTYNTVNYKYYSHQYDGGQHCDENNKPRRTEVRYIACTSSQAISVVSVTEEKICEYVITVCIPDLKKAEYFKTIETSPARRTIVSDEFYLFPTNNIILEHDGVLKPIQGLASYEYDAMSESQEASEPLEPPFAEVLEQETEL